MPREIQISPEVAALVAGAAPGTLRQFIDAAEGEEVFCAISRRMLPPTVPVSVIAYRDPGGPEPSVHLQYADARLHGSAVIDRPGLRESLARPVEREVAWCTLHDQTRAGLAFQVWARFYLSADSGPLRDADRARLEGRGWRAPVEGFELPADHDARLTLRPRELALSFPHEPDAYVFAVAEPLPDDWLRIVRRAGDAIVLYGCGVRDRFAEALRLGDLVGAAVPFTDETDSPPSPSRSRRQLRRWRWRRRRR